eukprot:1583747-Prymnesium_polylepis.2
MLLDALSACLAPTCKSVAIFASAARCQRTLRLFLDRVRARGFALVELSAALEPLPEVAQMPKVDGVRYFAVRWADEQAARTTRAMLAMRDAPAHVAAPSSAATTADDNDADVSGALAWAAACAVDGSMRTWVDMEGHACVEGHRIGFDVMLWTVSLVLLRYLERAGIGWRDGRRVEGEGAPLRVLELSAGAGHLAVGLARLGAEVMATECTEEHDTNAWRALVAWVPHLLRTDPGAGAGPPPYRAGARGGTLSLQQLNWGSDDGLGAEALEQFDVLILSELVALGDDLQAHTPAHF